MLVIVALRRAAALELEHAPVADCHDLGDPVDERFTAHGPGSLAVPTRAERGGALAGVTGHIAESVIAAGRPGP